jgi:hypothetical protein
LTYAGGGLNSLGGIAIDAEGNAWAANNLLVGSRSTLYDNFGGGVSKLAPGRIADKHPACIVGVVGENE